MLFWFASRNLHISGAKELFNSAVRDRIITGSTAGHLRSAKREKPIRFTPILKQFKAIIADVRAQVFNADAQDSADFLEFLGLAGLGQAEARSLTRGDVDLAAGQIITYRHKTATGVCDSNLPTGPAAAGNGVHRESSRFPRFQNF
jgi:integrase